MSTPTSKFDHNSLCPLHPASTDQQQQLTSEEFRRAFPDEGQVVEFKTGASREQLARTTVAFSNADGGVILIGVTDDGEPIHRGPLEGWMRAAHEAITTNVRDPGKYYLRSVQVDDYDALALCISPRKDAVCQMASGLPLVRRGDRDMPLIGSDLSDLVLARLHTHYDETSTSLGTDAIGSGLLEEIAPLYHWNLEEELDNDRLMSQGLLTDDSPPALTVTGVLFLTAHPRTALGKAYVEVRRYPDDHSANYDRREEFDGQLAHQVRDSTNFVMAELGHDFVVTNLYRYQLPRIPERVLREGVANAIAHRSYETSGTPIVIQIRPSRVVIISPGGLLDPVTEENLRHTQAARNPRIIGVLRRYRLAEDAGRGIDVMQDEMSAALLDPPRFRDLGHAFEVALPIHSPIAPEERAWVLDVERQGRIEPQDRLLLVHAAREDSLTNAHARAILNVDAGQARSSLQRLVDAGLLQRHGSRGGAYYTLSTKISPPTSQLTLAQLLDYLTEQSWIEPLTNRRVRALARVDSKDARGLLNMLVNDGRLERVGERRGTKYLPLATR